MSKKNKKLVDYGKNEAFEKLCSADSILDRIKHDSGILYENIQNENYDLSQVFPTDEFCKCRMGWGVRPFVNKFYCIGCELLRRISDSVKVPEDRIIKIQVGKYINKRLRIYEVPTSYGSYTYNQTISFIHQKILSEIQQTASPVFMNSSNLTNQIVIMSILNNKMQKYKLPNLTNFEWSYFCENSIKLVMNESSPFSELINYSSFKKKNKTVTAQKSSNPLRVSIVYSVLKQLISILLFYGKYELIHGNPSLKYIKFTFNEKTYKFEDIRMEVPIIMHLEICDKSSLTFTSRDNKTSRLVGNGNVLTMPSETIPIEDFTFDGVKFEYRIGNKLKNYIEDTSVFGIPIFTPSFEFYCFLISILCEESFYISFIEDDFIIKVWYNLWKEDEYESVMKELSELKYIEDVNFETISAFLSKYTLRSDALDFFWQNIKSM